MLLALVSGFALSQAFRTITAIMATGLQEFGLSAQALGVFAGTFAFAFGTMQLFMGIAIDFWGIRRTLLVAFPMAIAGAALSVVATGYSMLLLGQVLIGGLCARLSGVHGVHRPLLCAVALRRRVRRSHGGRWAGHAVHRHAAGVAGGAIVVALGVWGAGGPGGAGLASDLLEGARAPGGPCRHGHPCNARTLGQTVRGFGALFLLPHTVGILLLALMTYASMLCCAACGSGPC
jgi:sugar phosphate permease